MTENCPSHKQWKIPEPAMEKDPVPAACCHDSDPVNHPCHYTHGGIEVIDAIEAWNLGYHLGNVVKYIARARYKDDYLQDLEKAEWYLRREIERRIGQ